MPPLYQLPGFHEPFNALSHLLGAVIFLALGLLLLWRGRGNRARLACLGIYAGSCVFLFSMSGVYHMMAPSGLASQVMVRLDHAAIFVLIAGTFTPVHGLLFRGWLRWGLLLFIWTVAITAITLKTVLFDRFSDGLGLTFYLALGWFGAVSGVLLARRHGFTFIKPLVWGGVAYSIGGVMEALHWPVLIPGVVHQHEVFHVAVLVGAVFHWSFIWQFAAGQARAPQRAAAPPFDLSVPPAP